MSHPKTVIPSDDVVRPIVEHYFWEGYSNQLILRSLSHNHNIEMGNSSLNNRLSRWNLFRSRKQTHTEEEIKTLIDQAKKGVMKNAGIREMCSYLLKEHKVFVKRYMLFSIDC